MLSIRQLLSWPALIIFMTAIGMSVDFHAPPRFDETGYAILGLSLAQGQGYREIDKPDHPLHSHFPPGWPMALAAAWSVVSPASIPPATSAHALIFAISIGSIYLWGVWFQRISGEKMAIPLCFGLAGNWFWIRLAGELRSESLFILLSAFVFLVESDASEPRNKARDILSGVFIGMAILTRQAAVALLIAVVLHHLLKQRRKSALITGSTSLLTISPWLFWIATSGKPAQATLLASDELSRSLARRLADQSLFYMIRLPDSLFGPFLETATVFRSTPALKAIAWLQAACFAMIFFIGLVKIAKNPKTLLAAVYLVVSLAMLIAWPFTEAGRFLIPLVPVVLLAFTIGLSSVHQSLDNCRLLNPYPSGQLVPWLVVALCLPFGLYTWQKQLRGNVGSQDHDFNQACAWLARNSPASAIIASRHPGDVFWRSGRAGVHWPESGELGHVHRAIFNQNAAYLLVDTTRYAKMTTPAWASPVSLALYPNLFREVAPSGWSANTVRLYEVRTE